MAVDAFGTKERAWAGESWTSAPRITGITVSSDLAWKQRLRILDKPRDGATSNHEPSRLQMLKAKLERAMGDDQYRDTRSGKAMCDRPQESLTSGLIPKQEVQRTDRTHGSSFSSPPMPSNSPRFLSFSNHSSPQEKKVGKRCDIRPDPSSGLTGSGLVSNDGFGYGRFEGDVLHKGARQDRGSVFRDVAGRYLASTPPLSEERVSVHEQSLHTPPRDEPFKHPTGSPGSSTYSKRSELREFTPSYREFASYEEAKRESAAASLLEYKEASLHRQESSQQPPNLSLYRDQHANRSEQPMVGNNRLAENTIAKSDIFPSRQDLRSRLDEDSLNCPIDISHPRLTRWRKTTLCSSRIRALSMTETFGRTSPITGKSQTQESTEQPIGGGERDVSVIESLLLQLTWDLTAHPVKNLLEEPALRAQNMVQRFRSGNRMHSEAIGAATSFGSDAMRSAFYVSPRESLELGGGRFRGAAGAQQQPIWLQSSLPSQQQGNNPHRPLPSHLSPEVRLPVLL
eukprot:748626-Hanusia_phi.AAC.3